MAKKMTDDEVKQAVLSYVQDSITYDQSELSSQRAKSMQYYLGEPFGNEIEGKSQVVTRDVQETIDWIMPSLMKVFTSGDTVVQFTPQSAEDVPLAEQETEYINYLFLQRNNGVSILHDWFQDALINKNGIVKVYLEEEPKVHYDYYSGLTQEQLTEMLADPTAELLQKTEREDGLIDIKIRTTETRRRIKVCNVPPEEFIINKSARSLEDATIVGHRPKVTKSDLVEMGMTHKQLEDVQWETYDMVDSAPELLVRDSIDGTGDSGYQTYQRDATQTTRLTECYMKLDVDGDGIAELRRVVLVGDDFLFSNEEAPCIPFANICANRIAHKFHGLSVYDKIGDIQEIRSTLTRNILDNIYNLNNGRYSVVEGQVNLDDLLTNQSGGVVRTKNTSAINPLPVPSLSNDVYNMLDRMERDRGNRSGVSDTSRGLEDGVLHSNQAASAVNQVMTASEQQIELIARMFAETGVKDLFQLLHDFAIRYQDQKEVFELRGQFVTVNPSNWRKRTELKVTVGIGNMNKDQQLAHLMRMFEIAQTVVSNGGMGVLITEKNVYNMLKEMTINAGYKDVDKYWTDPDSPEAQKTQQDKANEPTPEEKAIQAQQEIEMAKIKSEQMKNQTDAEYKKAQAQIEAEKIELEKERVSLENRAMTIKEEELALEREKFLWEKAKNEAEYNLEKSQQRAAAIGDMNTPIVPSMRK